MAYWLHGILISFGDLWQFFRRFGRDAIMWHTHTHTWIHVYTLHIRLTYESRLASFGLNFIVRHKIDICKSEHRVNETHPHAYTLLIVSYYLLFIGLDDVGRQQLFWNCHVKFTNGWWAVPMACLNSFSEIANELFL